ncbi:penicillin-binding protein 1A [Streptococcus agalactiae LMG 14747]|uniref:Penicillin-binding protein 1A n=2 Tax=Streptococcus TaxID=1301 RepID=V6Z3P9_STRAG|nr:penicillin-binding protein PBP1A [Streptococcus acidominimus]ESV54229.1 penicillin-binding protein 1A [Streptococcus agalactiae LMG 14747]SNV44897.1 Multimodular transpeptidase-transglycosylase /Penicillin-binding protein 1A/1B (PBP1) [Streptococcus acidominimus]
MKHFSKIAKYLLAAIVSLVALGIIIGALLFTFYASTAPKLSEAKLKSTTSSLIYDSDNTLIADLGAEKRENVTPDNIPIDLVNAITSIEDHRFFEHRGIDVYRILGAAWNNLTSSSTQGGSTLDQQLIKLAYFSTNKSDQNLKRKAQEGWLAYQMEKEYTKEEILTFYINKVFMGNGNYGMLTAAKSYFGKDLKDLSVAQVALLAGIPQAPSQYDPYTNPEVAKQRRDLVLSEMYELKKIDKEQYDQAVATPISDGLQELKKESSYEPYLDNYLKEVIAQVKEKTGKDVYTAGLRVYTNVNSDFQKFLWDVYNTDIYVYYPDDKFQVASTVIDVTNGNVVAQLGGRKQENIAMGTNQAVLTDRDWGSTMKPITDYAPAIENGIYQTTAASIQDSYYTWPGTNDQVYNWDRKYNGNMTIQRAIQESRNVPAIKALDAVGLDNSLDFLNGLGINYPEMHYSNAISSNTTSNSQKYGASSEKMAAAYAAFANGGTYYEPMYINRIEFNDGTKEDYSASGKKAMKETTAYMMTDMMKSVLSYGTGANAAISGLYQAGKTGTSSYSDDELAKIEAETGIYNSAVGTMAPDETFVGYTSQYAMAVWTGYKNRSTPLYGSMLDTATNVYKTMMSYITGGYSENWLMPDGLYRSGSYVYLNSYTGNTNLRNYNYNSYGTNGNTFGTSGNATGESNSNNALNTPENGATTNSSSAASTQNNGNTSSQNAEQPNVNQGNSQGNGTNDSAPQPATPGNGN